MSNNLVQNNGQSCCPKCGSVLRAEYYFCAYCAEQWRHPEQGLEPTPEPVWDAETRIRRRAHGAYDAFFAYLVAIFVASWPAIISGGKVDGSILTMAFNAICIAVATVWVASRNLVLVRESLRLEGLVSPWFVLGLILLAPMLAINHFYHELLMKQTSVVVDSSIYALADRSPLVAMLMICVFPAVFEEIGFRSCVYPVLQRALTPVWAAVISSALFAALHLSLWSWPYLFAFGLLLAFVTTKSRSVLPCMVLHFVHNATVIFLLPRL